MAPADFGYVAIKRVDRPLAFRILTRRRPQEVDFGQANSDWNAYFRPRSSNSVDAGIEAIHDRTTVSCACPRWIKKNKRAVTRCEARRPEFLSMCRSQFSFFPAVLLECCMTTQKTQPVFRHHEYLSGVWRGIPLVFGNSLGGHSLYRVA